MQNNIKLLLIILIVLAGFSLYVMKNKTSDVIDTNLILIPALENNINDIDSIEISKNEQNISLYKLNNIWHITQLNDYLADANKIANLLLSLRKITIKDKKTTNPKNYSKLGLGESGINAATIIRLKSRDKVISQIAIGKQASHGLGIYIRKLDNPQSYLADGSLSIKMNHEDWIVTRLFDINPQLVKNVTFTPKNATKFNISKNSIDDNEFTLANLPVSKSLKDNIALSNFAGGLQKLSIESLNITDTITKENLVNTIIYELFTGEVYQLNLHEKGEVYYLTININKLINDSFVKKLEN